MSRALLAFIGCSLAMTLLGCAPDDKATNDFFKCDDGTQTTSSSSGGGSTDSTALNTLGPIGLDALTRFDRLPYLRTGERALHESSYDRTGGNVDMSVTNNYLYLDETPGRSGDKVLLDARGPGCVYRMWFTSQDFGDQMIHITFDDEQDPRIEMKLRDLFSGRTKPFLAPLVAGAETSSGGYYSDLPLPFATAIRITASGGLPDYYFNIDYHLFDPTTSVETWRGDEDSSAAIAMWQHAGANPQDTSMSTELTGTIDELPPNQASTILDVEGPREIVAIEMRVGDTLLDPPGPSETLNNLFVRISWDHEASPSVDAPIGSFFAVGSYAPGVVNAIPAGMRPDGTMYLFFPMPFAQHAKIELVNTSTWPIENIWYRVLYQPFTDSFANVGTFKVAYAGNVESTPGQDAIFVDVDGAGQIVGVVESMFGPSTPAGYIYLEGDEHAFIDGRHTASLQGTGTEDFFNGGWYFNWGTLFSQPTHGFSAWTKPDGFDGRAMHRFFLGDAIPFRSQVRFGIQHGGRNDVQVTSSLLAYYYAQPSPRATCTDALVTGNAASEASHGYNVSGETWQGTRTFTFEEPDFTEVKLGGHAHKGTSVFTLKVDPNNHGVLLRRVMDDGTARQSADVKVGGTLVGRWYTPGKNATHQWREEDFWLPAALTAGKSSIDVTIEFVSSERDWNEFGYMAYSITE